MDIFEVHFGHLQGFVRAHESNLQSFQAEFIRRQLKEGYKLSECMASYVKVKPITLSELTYELYHKEF